MRDLESIRFAAQPLPRQGTSCSPPLHTNDTGQSPSPVSVDVFPGEQQTQSGFSFSGDWPASISA